jgi:Domain of unknown function (DUF1963)
MEGLDDIRRQLRRRAIVFDVTRRAFADAVSSWFGRVSLGLPGETWPEHAGEPMLALCQFNLSRLPFRPPRLDDIEFMTVFIGKDIIPDDTPNGDGWCLRTYRSLGDLVPIQQPTVSSTIAPLPMHSRVVQSDFPCWDDVSIELPTEIDEKYHDLFENTYGVKLGGWPSLIQSELWWAPHNKHPASPEYVFQIDSVEQCKWMWADNGVGYFGRGTAPSTKDEWTFTWQCY